jgi:histidyl-tRNA synthetase
MEVRRQAISIESLKTEAPERIHAMLVGLVEKKTRDALIRLIEPAKAKVPEAASLSEHQLVAFPKAKLQEFAHQAGASDAAIQDALGNDQFFADADGDGQRGMNDMHTLEEIRELYTKLDVNTAELLGLRLYTGPMFEFFNNVLRAKGGKVPFGWSYPGLKDEVTTGKFVTTIVSNLRTQHAAFAQYLHVLLMPRLISAFFGRCRSTRSILAFSSCRPSRLW